MAEITAAQQNTSGQGLYYIGIDRSLCAPAFGLTASALFQSGYISTAGQLDDAENKIKSDNARSDFKKHLGLSPATVSRNNNRFKNTGIIEKSGKSSYVIHTDKLEGNKKWNCPLEVLTGTFDLEEDDGTVTKTTFTDCQCLVYAYYYTLLPHTGKNYRTLEATFDEVANELGIDPSTVSDAVKKLRKAKLIYFPSGWNGQNRYKKSKIGLRRNFSWFKREQEYRARLEDKKEKTSSDTKPAKPQEKTQKGTLTRESYYGELQAAAARKADKALKKALKNEAYKELDEKLSAVKEQMRHAMIYNDAITAKKLTVKINMLTAQQASVLENIGLSEDKLKPEHYAKCKLCKDTGWLPDGKNCGCFNNRGSPPKKAGKKDVGESNRKN